MLGVGSTMAKNVQPITLILAASNPALGIGKAGGLPWRLKKEMKYFRQVTQGSTVLMGRKTWESIPPKFRPLPGRTNVVITRNSAAEFGEGVVIANSVEDALQKTDRSKPIFVMGGGMIYEASLPYADRILLTLIEDPEGKFECDTFFNLDKNVWKRQEPHRLREILGDRVDQSPANKVVEDGYEYTFTVWEKAE